jgi:hypothetical protein
VDGSRRSVAHMWRLPTCATGRNHPQPDVQWRSAVWVRLRRSAFIRWIGGLLLEILTPSASRNRGLPFYRASIGDEQAAFALLMHLQAMLALGLHANRSPTEVCDGVW